ncbi:COG3650 family protein [Brevundimonas balnearis]|uniref:COG3650 family protein n=1 Tax=Brevundimonas balnearis TaxID=1572858 RepID=A0ABV6R2G2_9CAUL
MRSSILCALALALAACDSQPEVAAGPPAGAPEPSPAVLGDIDLNQPIRALGTEPFWGVDVTPGALTLTGVDIPEQRFETDGPEVMGTTAVWRGTDGQGQDLTLTLIATECSDGMSDRLYPLTARIEAGERELTGCADLTSRILSGEGA